jgi:hypothetical protein
LDVLLSHWLAYKAHASAAEAAAVHGQVLHVPAGGFVAIELAAVHDMAGYSCSVFVCDWLLCRLGEVA